MQKYVCRPFTKLARVKYIHYYLNAGFESKIRGVKVFNESMDTRPLKFNGKKKIIFESVAALRMFKNRRIFIVKTPD
jgi:hypothetical protein